VCEGRTVLFSGAHGQQDKAVFFLPDQHKIEGDRSLMLSQIEPCDDLHYHLPVRFSLIKDVFIERGSSIKVGTSTLIEKQVDGLATKRNVFFSSLELIEKKYRQRFEVASTE